jgi:hypothetical protein
MTKVWRKNRSAPGAESQTHQKHMTNRLFHRNPLIKTVVRHKYSCFCPGELVHEDLISQLMAASISNLLCNSKGKECKLRLSHFKYHG